MSVNSIRVQSYSAITGGSPSPVGVETTVHTGGTGTNATASAVAVDASGNYAVSYQINGLDGSGFGIYAQRRSADSSTVLTAEFLVNTVTTGSQQFPDVAMDGSGNFNIVWSSPNVDGAGGAVVMQRYNASAVAQGSNTTVNTGITTGNQADAHISATSAGTFLVTWWSEEADLDGVGTDVYYKTFNSSGGVVIGDTLINTGPTASNDQSEVRPVTGITSSGDFVVMYSTAAGAAFDAVFRRYAEAPTVSFTAATSSGAESANAVIGVTRGGAQYARAALATTTSVSVTGGTATAGNDFTNGSPYAVSFPANGSTSQSVTITISGDTLDEDDKTILLGFGTVTNGTAVSPTTHTYTITDDDASPSVSVSNPSVTEGNAGTATLSFTVSLSTASGRSVAFNYATANGTATTADNDYVAASGSMTFTAGQTTKTVSVTVNGDTKFEANETISLNLTGITNASNTTASGTGTINNDDTAPTVSLSVSPATVAEAAGASTVTATLSAASGVATTVTLTLGGTATLTSDYTISSTTISIPAGSTVGTATLTAVQDTTDEVNETVTVAIGSATNATPGGSTQTVTITDDDSGPTANGQSVTTLVSTSKAVTLTGTENSTPQLSLTYTVATNPGFGTLSGTAPNLTYTPNAGYVGTDSFTFTVTNGATTSSAATVSLTVSKATVGGTATARWGTTSSAALATAGDGLRLLPTDRATSLPWVGVNRLAVTLDAATTLAAADVTVTGTAVANYGPVTVSGTSPNFTLTFAQSVTVVDRVTVTIGSARINTFTRRLDVVPADVTDDGVVNTTDLVVMRNQAGPVTSGTLASDYDGDGTVANADFTAARPKLGTALPGPLFVAPGGVAATTPAPAVRLTAAALAPVLEAAIRRWQATGLTAAQVALLRQVTVTIGDIGGGYLGLTPLGSTAVTLDATAAGVGWYIDPTPMDDYEFPMASGTTRRTTPQQAPAGRIDLLTVVMHELGHVLGRDSTFDPARRTDLMHAYLLAGERRLPGPARLRF